MFEEVIEKYTIETVSERTKISRKNLERLRNGDLEGITRTQAYGFLRILQREFGEDFDDLRRCLDDHFAQQKPVDHGPIFQRKEATASKNSRGWIVALVLGALLALGGYLYFKAFSQKSASCENEALSAAVTRPQSTPKPAVDRNVSKEGETQQSVQTVSEEQAQAAPAAVEANETNETVQAEADNISEPKKPLPPLEPVVLTPTKRIWIGVIDLKSKKRTAKVTAHPFEIPSRGRRLLVTGHGKFRLADIEGSLFKFDDVKKHYFLIEEGRVKELNKTAFKRLNGGRVW